ncbi:MAG: prenyltransferase/squalene oxidase repeat-containing protein [Streptosporangiales bacterium]
MTFAVVLAAAFGAALLLPASAQAQPVPASKHGLYGAQDPTYDGAFRQSLAILALNAAGEPVPAAAITWLVRQQCGDGGWTAFRKNLDQPCQAKSEDSNSTAMAVQALARVGGQTDAANEGVSWLRSHQNADGGIGYNSGQPSDANSTALFAQALVATSNDPTAATSDKGATAYDALLGLQIGCDSYTDQGAFAYQQAKGGKDLEPNALATSAALFALTGQALPVTQPGSGKAKELSCPASGDIKPAEAAAAAGKHMADLMKENSWHVPSPQGNGDDWGTTATTAIGLAALGATNDAQKAMSALAKHADSYVQGDGGDTPAALANVILAAVATGQDPHKVADDSVQRLQATAVHGGGNGEDASATPSATSGAAAGSQGSSGTSTGGWVALVVLGLIVAIGAGVLLSRRAATQSTD